MVMLSASMRAEAKSTAAPSRWALVRRIALLASNPRIWSASAWPLRPPASNSSRSKLELTWMSMLGVAVGTTWPWL